jgi:hypothetical protein
MKFVRLLFLLGAFAGLAACGKPDLTCDDPSPYQLAVSGKRVQPPTDLDKLEPLREMPLPDASPAKPRTENSPCLDLPPAIAPGR